MTDLEMPDEETQAETAAEGDDPGEGGGRTKSPSHRQSALRDLSRARKMMRSDESGLAADLLLQSAMVKALFDLADAIRDGRSPQ
jgi:hypothetical protein